MLSSGELPPYFMARGARLSGYDPDDEEMAEFEELQRLKERPEDMSFIDRAKLSVEKLVERVGFFGILACASVSEWLGRPCFLFCLYCDNSYSE